MCFQASEEWLKEMHPADKIVSLRPEMLDLSVGLFFLFIKVEPLCSFQFIGIDS